MSEAYRILLVEDDRDIRESVGFRLRAAGYKTMSACNGCEGIESAIENGPDAIVLDVRMPKMDGLTALTKLKRLRATRCIPIVMLSTSLIDQQAALDAGARYFVVKPFAADRLLAAVSSAIQEKWISDEKRGLRRDGAARLVCGSRDRVNPTSTSER